MNTMLKIVAVAAALASSPGCSSPKGDEPGTLKVLMIGNSFSISCLRHLPQVAQDRGVDLDLASLYIGGCSLKRHWENVEKSRKDSSFRPYRFDRIVKGKKTVDGAARNIPDALGIAKWDVVVIQQASHDSWREETYHPYGDNLVAYIREQVPGAKIVVQETWSYTPWDKRLAKWGIDQNQMYERLHAAYGAFAKRHGLQVIPFGTAIQAWRRRLPVKYTESSFGGDVVGGRKQRPEDMFKRTVDNKWVPNCDVFHLGDGGEYFQALVWAASLFDGVDLAELEYRPDFVTEDEAKLMREIAMGLD
ncbi:MAG: DUF4886 domain-containing protein [Kiritimatiellae bacterium]|nr:DUF4886 domain-containing protein [Kiritimatiellia bacterium]